MVQTYPLRQEKTTPFSKFVKRTPGNVVGIIPHSTPSLRAFVQFVACTTIHIGPGPSES